MSELGWGRGEELDGRKNWVKCKGLGKEGNMGKECLGEAHTGRKERIGTVWERGRN